MATPRSNESYPDPQVEQLLAATLLQVRTAMGQELAETLLPERVTLLGVRTELFQSPTLAAGRDVMPGHYPAADRNLIILTLQDDQQVFLVGGKINPTDRFEFSSALGGGVDPRDIHRQETYTEPPMHMTAPRLLRNTCQMAASIGIRASTAILKCFYLIFGTALENVSPLKRWA